MSNTLKTPEVVNALAAALGTTKKEAKEIYSTVFDTIADLVVEHQAGVPLGSLGRVIVEEKAEREYAVRDMSTGKQIGSTVKPAHFAPKVKVSKAVKSELAAKGI